jgi:hypothetical protein
MPLWPFVIAATPAALQIMHKKKDAVILFF